MIVVNQSQFVSYIITCPLSYMYMYMYVGQTRFACISVIIILLHILNLLHPPIDVKDTLSELDRVISYYHVSEDVEAKIREGPSGNIKTYLGVLDKLKDALKFFKQNNPESLELSHINELLESGLDALQREFLQLLQKHSRPVHIATLRDIAACDDVEGREREREREGSMDRDVNFTTCIRVSSGLPSVDLLPPKVITDLRDVATYYLDSPAENNTGNKPHPLIRLIIMSI